MALEMYQKPQCPFTLDKLPCPVLGVLIARGTIIFIPFKISGNFIELLVHSSPLQHKYYNLGAKLMKFLQLKLSLYFFHKKLLCLGGMALWLERGPVHRRVAGLIPNPGVHVGGTN